MLNRTRIVLSFLFFVGGVCPAVFGEANRYKSDAPVQPIALTSHAEEIGMEYRYYGETIKRDSGGRIRYSNNYFQEYISGRLEGYVYHPRFLEFSTELKLGLAQQRLRRRDSDGESHSADNDELVGYDVRIDVLREHPVSATVTATQDERILMGLFVDRYMVRTKTQRGTVRWTTPIVQMDATLSHTDTEEFGAVSQSRTFSDVFAYNLHHQLGRRIRTDVRYTYQDFERRFRADTTTGDVRNESQIVSQTLNLDNRIDLTEDRRATLHSNFRVHDQKNNTDLRTYYWQERLKLEHTPNLSSYATGSFLRNEYPTSKIDTYRGEIGADHQLYESLKTHLDIHGRRTDYGRVKEDRYGVTARLNYRKKTLAGVLSAGYARTLDRVVRTGVAASEEVFDESHIVHLAITEFLDQPDVVTGTVVVTDINNLITYTEGFDYEIIRQGQRTGLRVLPGGLLADGDTVLVDYRIELDGSLRYFADDEDYHIRHDFTRYLPGLSLYARRHESKARSVKSEIDPRLLEYIDQSVGLRQEWRAYAFTTEYQEYRDDLGGFDQWRTQLEGNHPISRALHVGWNAGYTQTDYKADDVTDFADRSRYYFAGANVGGSFARSGYWKVEGRTIHETGRIDQVVHGITARAGYDWRRLSLEGGARFEQYDVFESQRDRMQVFVALKWRLSKILRPRGKS